MTYKYKWSTEAAVVTVLALAVTFGVVVPMFASAGVPWVVKLIVGAMVFVPLAWVATWTPLSLTVDGRGVYLRKLAGGIKIPAGEIVESRHIGPEALKWSLRTFGSGGFCGCLGRFWNKRLGHYTMYVTDRKKNLFLVRTHKRTYVFNYPANP